MKTSDLLSYSSDNIFLHDESGRPLKPDIIQSKLAYKQQKAEEWFRAFVNEPYTVKVIIEQKTTYIQLRLLAYAISKEN